MNARIEWNKLLAGPDPLLALAPMQDVTDLPFWRLISSYGGPDLYFTEYFRVHAPPSRANAEGSRGSYL